MRKNSTLSAEEWDAKNYASLPDEILITETYDEAVQQMNIHYLGDDGAGAEEMEASVNRSCGKEWNHLAVALTHILTPKEKLLVKGRYFEDKTYLELGRLIDKKPQWTRQQTLRALSKVRKFMWGKSFGSIDGEGLI